MIIITLSVHNFLKPNDQCNRPSFSLCKFKKNQSKLIWETGHIFLDFKLIQFPLLFSPVCQLDSLYKEDL